MTRLRNAFWLLLAGIAGLGVLFQVKYEVQALEKRMATLVQETARNEKAIHVLQAEWSYLNEPGRLAALTQRHLQLAPLTAAQLGRFEDVPLRIHPLNPGLAMPPHVADEIQPDSAGSSAVVEPGRPQAPANGGLRQASAESATILSGTARALDAAEPEDTE